jgi:hypothetical protein
MKADIWLSYVDSLIWQRHHLDDSSWNTFLRAGNLGIDPQAAMTQVAQRIKRLAITPNRANSRANCKERTDTLALTLARFMYQRHPSLSTGQTNSRRWRRK